MSAVAVKKVADKINAVVIPGQHPAHEIGAGFVKARKQGFVLFLIGLKEPEV